MIESVISQTSQARLSANSNRVGRQRKEDELLWGSVGRYRGRHPLGIEEELERIPRHVHLRGGCNRISALQRVGSPFCCLTPEQPASGGAGSYR